MIQVSLSNILQGFQNYPEPEGFSFCQMFFAGEVLVPSDADSFSDENGLLIQSQCLDIERCFSHLAYTQLARTYVDYVNVVTGSSGSGP